MPSKRDRRKDTYLDGGASETDENYTNSQKHNIANPASAGGADERGDSNANDHTNDQAGGGGSDKGKVSSSPQPKHKATLIPWTTAVGETLQSLEETQRAIKKLQKVFTSHKDDLERIDETSSIIHQLEEVCRQKDEEMNRQEMTILTLNNIETKAKAQNEHEAAQIEKEKNELKQEREKLDKRVTVVAAEEKLKINQELEKRTREIDEMYKKRKQKLEDEFVQKRDENDRRAKFFEAERERLSTAVKEKDKQIKVQAEELDKINDLCDVLNRAKKSIRDDMLDREVELEAMKKEFALDPRPMDYFVRSFAEIETQIKNVAENYFHDIEGKDWGKVHDELAAADPFFRSVPIDNSEDSLHLCMAHAQRVISNAICEDIWKPFSSEFTALHPESSVVLGKISEEIDQSDHGGRTAKFWNARTMRALKSLPADSVTSPGSESTEYTHPARTDSVISKVLVLSPLVKSSQEKSLRMDLVNLVNSAVDVWDNGQTGGSKITVNLLLDRAHREEWRSPQFDLESEGSETNPDPTSTTYTRIFPLFPRVLAPGGGNLMNHGSGLPGSWPADSDLTIIHPGRGLPEWSPLVVRGQVDQEENQKFIRTAIEKAKKELQNTKRASGIDRRGSRGSGTSGTPSEQWKRGGVVEFVEK